MSWNLKSTPYSPLGQFLSDLYVGCANKITYRNFYFLFVLGFYLFSYLRKHFKQINIQTAPAISKTNWELGIGDCGYSNWNSNPSWVVGPLSESYVNRGDQRKPETAAENQWMRMRLGTGNCEWEWGGAIARDLKPYKDLCKHCQSVDSTDWLTDILTHDFWDVGCVWLAVCIVQKALSVPNKMKVKNCVHVNTSHISVMPRNQTTNRLGPAVSTSFSQCLLFFCCCFSKLPLDIILTLSPVAVSVIGSDCGPGFVVCNAFLTFYWLKSQQQHWRTQYDASTCIPFYFPSSNANI